MNIMYECHKYNEVGLDLKPLTADDLKFSENELRETPEIAENAIEELRYLIESLNEINVPIQEEFLLKFLRPTKFYPESAYKLLKSALLFKEANRNLIGDLMPVDEEKAFLSVDTVNVLIDRDGKGRRILVLFAGERWNPDILSTDQIFRLFYLIHQAAIIEERTQIRGGIVIFDFHGLSMKHVRSLGTSFALKLITFCQEAMPIRLKEVHIIRQPYYFNIIWNIFKPFLNDKLKKRTFFHGYKMESLHKYIPPSHLPEDFGGSKPAISYNCSDWYPVLRGVESKIKEWNKCHISRC